MADAMAAIMEAIAINWKTIAIIILAATTILPWLGLIALNFFNHNIWQEITATFDRKRIKLLQLMQNGSGTILYRKMTKERKILVKEDKKEGHHEYIEPTTPPIQDSNSHRQFYIAVEGVEGTLNPLALTHYDVNSPMRKMGHTMSFEAGRQFERLYNPKDNLFSWVNLLQIAVPAILLIVLLIFVLNQGVTMAAIQQAIESNTGVLNAINEKIQSTFVLGGT